MDPFAKSNVYKARVAQQEKDKQFGIDTKAEVTRRVAERERIAKQPAPKPYKPNFDYKGG